MDEAGVEPQPLLDRGTLTEHSADPLVDEAGRQLRAPWAAGLAGILFAVLFTGALLLIRSSPLTAASNAQLVQLFAQGRDQWLLIGGLYLAPFAGIMFLWFIAVVRDQVGEREDRFFATVFLGSGLIFVALVFAAAAVASTVAVAVRELGLDAPTVPEVELGAGDRVHAPLRIRDPGCGRLPVLDGHAWLAQRGPPPLVGADRLPDRAHPPARRDVLGLDHPALPGLGGRRQRLPHSQGAVPAEPGRRLVAGWRRDRRERIGGHSRSHSDTLLGSTVRTTVAKISVRSCSRSTSSRSRPANRPIVRSAS